MKTLNAEAWNEGRSEAFGEDLARARKEARRSQRELAELSGTSHTTIARLERRQAGSRGAPVRPMPNTLAALARGLATDTASNINQDVASEHFQRFMRICGYDEVDPGQFEAHAEDAAMPDLQIIVTIRYSDRMGESVEVTVTGADPEQTGRLAREAYESARRRARPAADASGPPAAPGEGAP